VTIPTLDHVNVQGKRVLLRVDFNVPLEQGKVADTSRIMAALPTIEELQKKGAKVIILSHLGRPKGHPQLSYSLNPVVEALHQCLGTPVEFCLEAVGPKALAAVHTLQPGHVLLLENVRFYAGEEKNDSHFAQQLAELGDIYVNDAFSVSHRAHASVEAITHYLPSYAGRLVEKELKTLDQHLHHPERPLMALLGGAKISTKLVLLKSLLEKVDLMAIGGGMSGTFLYSQGHEVGKSLCEPSMKQEALDILEKAKKRGIEVILPVDVVVATDSNGGVPHEMVSIDNIGLDQMILDVGPKTLEKILRMIDKAKTLVWNGPLGRVEVEPFDRGTRDLAKHIGAQTEEGKLSSISGGGDTAAILNQAGCFDQFTYVSMAGGAFLEWLEGHPLPGIEALKAKNCSS
jgi:phosphoglycerate kinase